MNDISFTAKCQQIKDAQWVCKTAKSVYPHLSTTWIAGKIFKYQENNPELYDRFINKKSFEHIIAKNNNEQNLLNLFTWHKYLVQKINILRDTQLKNAQGKINHIIEQVKHHKLGNCGEDAIIAETILKLNGVKNACTSSLKIDGALVDHSVCVFNKDGSEFNGKVSKDTIIIDPWFGDADFASNMFVKYKNLANDYFFRLHPRAKISLTNIKSHKLSGADKIVLSLNHEKFLFSSANRELMK